MYELVPAVFEPIHAAAETESLPYKAWELLSPRVPTLSWRHNWDYCERLRRALVDKWLASDWPTDALLGATKRPQTFKRIVEYCADAYDRRRLLRRIARDINERPELATEDQRSILRRARVA
jgi:hypothetical protein